MPGPPPRSSSGNHKKKLSRRRDSSDESDYSLDNWSYNSQDDSYYEDGGRPSPQGPGGKIMKNSGRSPATGASKSPPKSSTRRARKVAPAASTRRGGNGHGHADDNSASSDTPSSPITASVFCGITFVGLHKFFITHSNVQHTDFDSAIAAMSVICTLLLLVPFHVLTSLGSVYLDDLAAHAALCHAEQGVTFDRIYAGYRVVVLFTAYSSLCGMILGLFFFLFKRTDPAEARL